MDLNTGVADLHMHTTASDGTCGVDDRVTQAVDRGFQSIAITDYDTILTDIQSRVTHISGIELIAGVEVRADVDGTKVELLGYYIDPSNEELLAVLEQVREFRRKRNRRMIEQLHEETDFDTSYQQLHTEAGGILARPYIADALLAEGIVGSIASV
jgi:predicted metal-dependent phosphoesterase TrpH